MSYELIYSDLNCIMGNTDESDSKYFTVWGLGDALNQGDNQFWPTDKDPSVRRYIIYNNCSRSSDTSNYVNYYTFDGWCEDDSGQYIRSGDYKEGSQYQMAHGQTIGYLYPCYLRANYYWPESVTLPLISDFSKTATTKDITLTGDGTTYGGNSNTSSSATITTSYTASGTLSGYAYGSTHNYTEFSFNDDEVTLSPSTWTESTSTGLYPSSLTTPTHNNSDKAGYTVSFDTKGGSEVTSLVAIDTYSHPFNGWYDSNNNNVTNTEFKASTTVYAHYDSVKSTLGSITLPSAPTKNGYTFKGWSETDGGSVIAETTYTPTSNTTLYAIWEEESHVYLRVNSSYIKATPYLYTNNVYKKAISYYYHNEWKKSK